MLYIISGTDLLYSKSGSGLTRSWFAVQLAVQYAVQHAPQQIRIVEFG